DLWILQDFANRETVATAKNQDAARSRAGGEARMNERFVVAIFVARTELQMAVKKKSQVILEAREHEMLVMRVASKNNFVGVDIVLGRGGNLASLRNSGTQSAQDNETRNAQTA